MGCISLDAAQVIGIFGLTCLPDASRHLLDSFRDGLFIDAHPMVAKRTCQEDAAVMQLPRDEIPSKAAPFSLSISQSILPAAQEDISPALSGNSCEKPAMRRAESKADAAICARPHERRTRTFVAECHDVFERLERHLAELFFPLPDHDVFILQGQVCILCQNEEGVEQMAHLMPPLPSDVRNKPQRPISCRHAAGRQARASRHGNASPV